VSGGLQEIMANKLYVNTDSLNLARSWLAPLIKNENGEDINTAAWM
jgi:hypothetical protein